MKTIILCVLIQIFYTLNLNGQHVHTIGSSSITFEGKPYWSGDSLFGKNRYSFKKNIEHSRYTNAHVIYEFAYVSFESLEKYKERYDKMVKKNLKVWYEEGDKFDYFGFPAYTKYYRGSKLLYCRYIAIEDTLFQIIVASEGIYYNDLKSYYDIFFKSFKYSDEKLFARLEKLNDVKYYKQYLEYYPSGKFVEQIRQKIKYLEDKLLQEKEEKANEEEKNRKIGLSSISVGDKICYQQKYTKTSAGFWTTTTTEHVLTVTGFVERKEGDKVQIRIADISDYKTPTINGVQVTKGDIIWVKPVEDINWYNCN